MRFYLLFLLGPLGLLGCAMAQMAVDDDLVAASHHYKISERPGVFSGKKLIFGPFSATNIDRSFIKSTGSGVSLSKVLSVSEKKTSQHFSYSFKGNNHWTSQCEVKGNSATFATVLSKEEIGIYCYFSAANGSAKTLKDWQFALKGHDLISARGSFKVGSKEILVTATNKIKGSSLSMGKPSGYYFHLGGKKIAGVDVINSKGPVWINKSLNKDMQDAIATIATALLLNQM